MARACMSTSKLAQAAQISNGSLCTAMTKLSVRPATAGKLAKALGVDVTEIIEDAEVE